MKRWLYNSLLVAFFTLSALLLAARYLLLPAILDHRAEIEDAIAAELGRGFRMADMQVSWKGWEPWLELSGVELLDEAQQPALTLPAVRAALSWTSLTFLEPRLSHLAIEGANLDVRRDPSGRLWVAGLQVEPGGEGDSPALTWLLGQGDVQILNARLTWLDEQRQAPALRLDDVQLRISNVVNLHRLAVSARQAEHPEARIDLQARFFTPLLTRRPADLSQWKGEVYLSTQGVQLTRARAWVDVPAWLVDASGGVRAWLDFDRMNLTRLLIDPRLSALELYSPELKQATRLLDVVGRVEWKRDFIDTHTFKVSDLKAGLPDASTLGPLNLEVKYHDDADESRRNGRIAVTDLHLGPLMAAARFFPLPDRVATVLEEASPRGHITSFTADWRGNVRAPERMRVMATFEGLGMGSVRWPGAEPLPSFDGISGEVVGDQSGGKFKLSGSRGFVLINDLIQNPQVLFDRLEARGAWSVPGRQGRRFELNWDQLDLQRQAMTVSMRGNMAWGKGDMPITDLTGRFNQVPVTDIPGFLPLALGPNALRWLNLNLRDGVVNDGKWTLKGDTWHFPFADGRHGEFLVAGKVDNGEVSFAADWPSIRGIVGDIRFANDSMTLLAKSARTRDATLGATTVRIPSFSAADWYVSAEGQAQGPLADMIRYVNTSPVGSLLEGFLADARATGPAKLALKLKVPLEAPEKTDVKGQLNFQDNDVFLVPGVPQLSRVRGALDFTQNGLTINGLQMAALGGTARVDAQTRPDRSIVVKADGMATAPALKRYLGVPDGLRAAGQTRYLATVHVKPGAGEPDITVESGLVGLTLDLPEPLVKPAAEVWPLEFRMLPTVVKNGMLQRDEFRLSLSSPKGPVLAGRLERDRSNGKAVPLRGGLALGQALTMPDQGIHVFVTLPTLDLDQWQRTQFSDTAPLSSDSLGLATPPARGDGPGLSLDRLFIKVDRLVFATKTFRRLSLSGQREKGRWLLDLNADEGKGQVVWSPQSVAEAEGSLKLNFSRLTIPESPPGDPAKPAPDPGDYFEIPTLDITVDQLTLGKINLGKLRLKAANEGEAPLRQWTLRDLQVINPDVTLNAKGDWRREQAGGPRRTRLDFSMDVQNAGRLLDRVGLEKLVRNGNGTVVGELQWRGAPQSFDYATMAGKLRMDIKDGQFLKAEPGVARLLGILSLQSLQRRLVLDFSDIFAAGFAFDQIFASANIQNGLLQTRDFKMRGTGATVLMEGKVDLVRETQDLRAVVLPEVNAAGGTLVYSLMAANPAVGLASFLAQLILKDPLSKVFSFDMKITGKWEDPVVEKVERGVVTPTR